MKSQANIEGVIQQISQSVSSREIEQVRQTSNEVQSLYYEGEHVQLVMVAHDLEGESY